ncbi:MAG: sel1 repeat family protein [Zoogloeaceae bacterium]|jgi:TPR repeat protein|nr:sel1 repeat family protein [Zoogloeaceae bacterium]
MKTSFAKGRIKGRCLLLCFLSLLLFAAPVFAQTGEFSAESARACRKAVESAQATREKAEAGDAQAQYALGLLFRDGLAREKKDRESYWGNGNVVPGEFIDLKRATALLARGFPVTSENSELSLTPVMSQILQEIVINPMAEELGESPELPELEEDVTEQSIEETMARAAAFLRKSGHEDLIDIFRPVFDSLSCSFSPLRFGYNDFEAVYWFRRAAEQGLPQAQFALGEAMLSNVGVQRHEAWNEALATRWFLKARAGGFAIAPDSGAGWLLTEYDQMQDFQKAAEAGDGAAAYALARAHERLADDTGIADAEKRAHREQTVKWLYFAVAKDVPEAKLWLARIHLGKDDMQGIPRRRAEGLEMLQRLAEAGNAEAQTLFADFAQKPAERMKWLQRAAEQDFDMAQAGLARAYGRGEGVPQDEKKALFWMRRAAAQDNSGARGWLKEFDERATLAQAAKGKGFAAREAQYELARAYLPYGDGDSFRGETPFSGTAVYLSPDPDKAAEAFRRLLAQRDTRDLEENQKRQIKSWRETAQSFLTVYEHATKEWRLLEKNARAGDARAQVALGDRYQHAAYSKDEKTLFGKIREDQEAAFHWFSAAAQAGDAEAQYRLGKWFLENRHDREAALPWLEKADAQEEEGWAKYSGASMLLNRLAAFTAAEEGDAAAQYALAYFYGQGDSVGVEKDTEKMLDWMHRAAEGGYPPAQYELGTLHAWPGFAHMNLETSAHWLHAAAKAGHPLAQYFYGKARYLGRGAPADEKEGRQWLEAAARVAEMLDEIGYLKPVFDEETGQTRLEFVKIEIDTSEQWREMEQQTPMWLQGVNPYYVLMSKPLTGASLAKDFLQNLDLRVALEKLAKAGDADAQFALGILLYQEQLSPPLRGGLFCMGCAADRYLPEEIAAFSARGVAWLRQAAKAGHWRARQALWRIETGDPREEKGDRAAAQEVLCQRALLPDECEPQEEAAEIQELRQAAQTGDAKATFRLGEALYDKYGYALNWAWSDYFGSPALARAEEARSLLLTAAGAGIARASCFLAQGYWKEGNTVDALFWFLKAQPEMPTHWLESGNCPEERWRKEEG